MAKPKDPEAGEEGKDELEDMFLVKPPGKDTTNTAKPKKKPFRLNTKQKQAIMILAPWAVFALACFLFTHYYHYHFYEVWVVVSFGFLIAFMFIAASMSDMDKTGGWNLFLGTLILFAAFEGVVAGLYNYQKNIYPYYAYDEFRHYTDVLPSELAASHRDAGMIVFAAEARVEVTMPVGFKAGSVYCVAPIMDNSPAGTPIQYWAIGKDCCHKRSKYKCDSALDPAARSGVVFHEGGILAGEDKRIFMLGVHESEAEYGLVSAANPILVSWVRNPNGFHDHLYEIAMNDLVTMYVVHLIVSVVLGFVMHQVSIRRRKY